MTTFDEEMMRRALQEAADDFVIADGAIGRILDEARDTASRDDGPRIRAFIQRNGRGRSTVFAAAACVALLAVAVPLFNSEGPAKPVNALGAEKKYVHGVALPASSNSEFTSIQGTGSAGTVATTGSSFTPTSGHDTLSVTTGVDVAKESSLRVEEVGTIHLTVGGKHFQSTLSQLTDFATTDGGFVASTQSHMGTKATHSYSTGSIILQVPEHNFTMLVDQVRHAGVATSVQTSATDVTGQYVDLRARIAASEVSRAQYLKIMTRTNSIGGILAVQDQLNSIQSQIEQMQAQLNLLNTETTYATLTVAVSESGHQTTTPTTKRTGVDKAWHDSLHGFAAGVEWLIRIAGPLLFALLLLTVLLVLGRWTWRATERRRGGIG
ncbi:MAG: DUF4349 domain-containing protein [Acidimicrobiales bacterium]|jgi:hypothetical protein